ncbi:MAG: hypothetical protein M3Y82_08635 [Verrucomicrobiota bacterium]|nr:hypothetical protein [Verrucomicrobiota bacterium]
MKTNTKFAASQLTRLILAATFGSFIWTGCSSTQSDASFSAADVDTAMAMAAPVSQIKRRPETHPELRSGLYTTAYQTGFRSSLASVPVVEAPTVENENPEAADSTHLFNYNPEVINVGVLGGATGTEVGETADHEQKMRQKNY